MIEFYLEFESNPTTKEAVEMELKVKRCTKFLKVCYVSITLSC
jgi:hypothetical protein